MPRSGCSLRRRDVGDKSVYADRRHGDGGWTICRSFLLGGAITLVLAASPSAAAAAEPVPLGRGINVELWGAFSRHGTPGERVERAKNAGFGFLRLGISITPWLGDEIVRLGYPIPDFLRGHAEELKARALRDLAEALARAGAERMRPLVAVFLVGTGELKGGRVLCDIPYGQQAYQVAFAEILAHIPDSPEIAIEPFNEPPSGCSSAPAHYATARGSMWPSLQWQLYQTVRRTKPHLVFVATAGGYEQLDALLDFDPTPFLADRNVVMAIHYYEPKLFTCQSGACGKRPERFARDIPWPADEARLPQARDATLAALGQDPLVAGRLEQARVQLTAAFERYRTEGTEAYLGRRLQSLADWAERYRLPAARILIGEFGVHRPTNDTTGSPVADGGRYLAAVRRAAESHHFSWAIWDLDGGMAFLCGMPSDESVCPAYRAVMAPTR
jgi:hypothetical protein